MARGLAGEIARARAGRGPGRPVTIARAVSTKARCPPTERTPRVVTAMSEPIAASETATTDSATSTSIRVKPAPRVAC